jgi:DNA-binding LacI/PurR family transcriptional regulator
MLIIIARVFGPCVQCCDRDEDQVSPRGTTERRPTQADVGKLADVSVGVVSAVVNNSVGGSIRVGSATEARVRSAIAKLGYVPNMAARQLAGGRNNVLGVFTYSTIFPIATDDFYYPMLAGIEEAAEQSRQNLLLLTGALNDDGTRAIYREGVNGLQIADGAILLGRDANGDEIRRLTADKYPFVYVGRPPAEYGQPSVVTAKYAEATAAVVGKAVALGHTRIAMIASDLWHPSMADRAEGYRSARTEYTAQLSSAELYSVPSDEPVDTLVSSLIGQGVTCIFVADCLVAQSAITTAGAQGVSVPSDLSIVSLSDYPGGPDTTLQPVTSLVTPSRELGYASVQLLLRLLTRDSGEPLHTEVACGFRQGETLAAAQGAAR